MTFTPGKQNLPFSVNLAELSLHPSLTKRYWHKDFPKAVHFTKHETKSVNKWLGWGCGIFSIFYALKCLHYKIDPEEILDIALSIADPQKTGVNPDQMIKILDLLNKKGLVNIKASLNYIGDIDDLKSLVNKPNTAVIADYWDDTFDEPYPSPSDPQDSWDWGHYAPIIGFKDGNVILASSSYRFYRYGYGLLGIQYDEFKRIHLDFVSEENSIDQNGFTKPGLTWFVGLVIVIENKES